jgi:hypothetical protein
MSNPMPADLKKVAREIVEEVLYHWDELHGFDKLESRLSEVRAQAYQEGFEAGRIDGKRKHGWKG